ncbi:hypothetical protein BOTCAL_0009g00190 [Botryotinia calthae]|uniref:Uncharacterized protein n=1 Tax=Botryotinia calthae TaxID=38488 RepID=A0A4Y8DJ91_9HELO|nr:hypothetical protein BOTCAL_0009g00190 [Botryotinia calthae]
MVVYQGYPLCAQDFKDNLGHSVLRNLNRFKVKARNNVIHHQERFVPYYYIMVVYPVIAKA